MRRLRLWSDFFPSSVVSRCYNENGVPNEIRTPILVTPRKHYLTSRIHKAILSEIVRFLPFAHLQLNANRRRYPQPSVATLGRPIRPDRCLLERPPMAWFIQILQSFITEIITTEHQFLGDCVWRDLTGAG